MKSLLAALALVVFEGEPLPDGRREVIIQLDAPWSWFVEADSSDDYAEVQGDAGDVVVVLEGEGGHAL